uniref:Cytochrome P450 CYP4A311 n=2 Tax=Mythimna separata TaxID=271217 RepID=A0A7G3WA69_MYTSE|nr:cytochrome P450 CYP4A311 [Mythimna separata]
MFPLIYFLWFCILVLGLHSYFRYNYGGRLIHKIKGPKTMFLFGNIFDIFITPVQMFYYQIEWRKSFGNLWKLNGFSFRAVYLYKPEDIEIVLSSTRYLDKSYPYTFLYPWLHEGLLTSAGEKWQHRRKMLTPAFHFLILKRFFATFCDHAQKLVNTVQKEVNKDESDLFPLISKATLGVICETAMGTTTGDDGDSLANKYFKPLHTLAWTMLYRVARIWYYSDAIFQFSGVAKIQKDALNTLEKFTTHIIQDRREYRKNNNISTECIDDVEDDVYGKKPKLAMLDLLLDEEKKGNIDEKGITEEVDTFMFEGHDTTATALCFMIMRLANEPDIQDKIAAEMKSIFGDSQRALTIEDLSKMKYLECCIKESLRMYPSVPFISRYIKEDVQIGDHTVPYNTMVNFNVFDIHRNPNIFPDPEKFIPERFLPENCISRHPYAYIPFSAGPRNCIGQKFALMELKTMMSSLLRRFKLEPVTKPEDLTFTTDVVLRTTHPIYVRFRNRISAL